MSNQDLYIPPHGIYFRLLGYVSQNVIFSRTAQEPQVGQIPVESVYSDQWFTLIHGTGNRKGTYAIKGKVSGNVLFSREGPAPNVGHVAGNGQYDDNWFKLEPGKGQYSKQFRLITPSAGVAVFSRTKMEPYLWNIAQGQVYSDQHFSYIFEDMNVDRIEYDLNLGKIISSNPLVLANQTLTNKTDHEQEMSFQLNETATHTSTFEYSTGFTITIGMSFKAGIPLIAETEFTVEASSTNQWTWGEQTSFSKSYTATFPVKAGPHETVRAVSTVNKGELEVPFTMYLSSKSTGTKTETKGIWRGVSTWDLRHTVS
ncbi:hypothetical protein NLI96_g4885 [Meripilus lineatus]|uniref:Hemolytic lectin LSLb n=1 Tax=Meripilus lineatus TaxID=2056292 RepID=A0AAD5V5Y2_9APHY|nr:hypothetical protein NLI96_g4885 [Physisporinus lineatus]